MENSSMYEPLANSLLDKTLAVVLVVVVPLAWGLGAAYVFEMLRRRRKARKRDDDDTPYEELA